MQATQEHQQSISANQGNSLAITEDKNNRQRVLAWGWNEFKQAGKENSASEVRPVEVADLADKEIASVASGQQHSLALTENGSVFAWGSNYTWQVGHGYNEDGEYENTYHTPLRVHEFSKENEESPYERQPLRNVIRIQAGDQHSLALKADGTVWSWGSNEFGQLGSHGTDMNRLAERVQDLSNITEIASYRSHNLALDQEGNVWAWGENWGGQMSNSLSKTKSPYKVQGLPPIQHISTGSYHSLALDENGDVWIWGINDFGLRDPQSDNYSEPIRVPGLSDIEKIASGDAHNLAIDQNGTLWAWGNNSYGEVGTGDSREVITVPEKIEDVESVSEIAAGDQFSIAKTDDGKLYTWGRNQYGQLGDGTTNPQRTPSTVNIKFVEGVKLNKSSVELKPNETTQLKATVFPEDAISKEVVWSSSNEDVVTVDEDGRIKAVADSSLVNEATITVTTKSGGYTDEAKVAIKIPVSDVEITKNVLTLERVFTDDGLSDDTYKLKANIYPYNATDKRIIWESEDEDIVSVNPQGVLQAESSGQTTVKATTIDGGWTDTIKVYVTLPVEEIHIRGEEDGLDMIEGQTSQLEYYIYPMNATDQYIYNWESSNDRVVEVNQNGEIEAKDSGSATITVTTMDKRKKGEIRIKVERGEHQKLSGFDIPSTLSMKARDTKKINAEFIPFDATNKKLYWRSSDKDIATVDENGNVKALASGKVTITARSADGNKEKETEVTVGPNVNGWLLAKERSNVSRSKNWDIGFNMSLNPESISNKTVYIEDMYNRTIETNISLSSDKKTITLSPEDRLKGDTIYYLYVTDQIESDDGTPLKNGTKMVFETY